ncbi:hypothetical protein CWI37_0014p0030 [Hamiltosporidium tvaerminnensis]|uniref:Uncharacterized protein n=1 Tax=Hamiltosporidium tvaerminnensis TaxID=1176355 RepID=A0A4Q9LEZ7_9MICR|nr:hypothetical protein CWI37_0014p0030 [Hamiltosporidium tvaerminnensis]
MKNINKTNFVQIKGFLKVKYRSEEGVSRKKCEENLLATLFNEIEKIKLQSNLYNARENELVSVSESLRWLKELKCDHVMKQYSAISRIEMYSGAQKCVPPCNQSKQQSIIQPSI